MSSHDLIESTQEDDVKIVENVIDLYRTNVSFQNQPIKITRTPHYRVVVCPHSIATNQIVIKHNQKLCTNKCMCFFQKITNSNVWNCDLIDKLDSLVRHHNAYVRNFRNIGDSLDATMKVYAIRVDSVCNDIRRLGYGIVPSTYFN